jgi:hypothetical protein
MTMTLDAAQAMIGGDRAHAAGIDAATNISRGAESRAAGRRAREMSCVRSAAWPVLLLEKQVGRERTGGRRCV